MHRVFNSLPFSMSRSIFVYVCNMSCIQKSTRKFVNRCLGCLYSPLAKRRCIFFLFLLFSFDYSALPLFIHNMRKSRKESKYKRLFYSNTNTHSKTQIPTQHTYRKKYTKERRTKWIWKKKLGKKFGHSSYCSLKYCRVLKWNKCFSPLLLVRIIILCWKICSDV